MVEAITRASSNAHPFVASLVRGRPFEEALRGLGGRRLDPLEAAFVAMRQAHSKEAMLPALDWARKVRLEGNDSSLVILFLCQWSQLAAQFPEFQTESWAVLCRAKTLIGPGTPAEVRALVSAISALGEMDHTGNHYGLAELTREAVRLIGPASPRYTWHLLLYARILSRQGRLEEVKGELSEIVAREPARYGSGIALMRFCDAVECARFAEAQDWLEEARKNPVTRQTMEIYERPHFEASLRLMRDPASLDLPDAPSSVRAILQLAAGRSEEALGCARRQEADSPCMNIRSYGFGSLNLLRCELACGHAEAARRLLELRWEVGNRHYLDDLFLARVELLSGRRVAALEALTRLCLAADRYRARARVDYELDLSREQPQEVWRGLLREVQGRGGESPRRIVAQASPCRPWFPALLGSSAPMERVRQEILRYAALEAPVLLTGETGTGKELVARALHEAGPRRSQPFVAVNCGAIPESLQEGELFGYARGAFTGAARAHRGYFEQAGGGTLLLDEIGEISPRLQVVLLRVLESGEIRPLGAEGVRRSACRIVAATNVDLEALAAAGRFRKDLLYRLRRLEIVLPPLRERREDVIPLMLHFLGVGRGAGDPAELAPQLVKVLREYAWPGNVRELKNLAEGMRLLNSEQSRFSLEALETLLPRLRREDRRPEWESGEGGLPVEVEPGKRAVREGGQRVERVLAENRAAFRQLDRLRELFRNHGKLSRREAARILGISPPTATQYLRRLSEEGLVEKVMPSTSPRSHYFSLCRAPRP